FAQLRETLGARGVTREALDSIRSPAGLNIGARQPEEVALSILAEIVQVRRARAEAPPAEAPRAAADQAIDPVCGMTVAVATARWHAEHGGRTIWFCNPRCREKFIADPQRYLESAAAGA
ncbi:MAG TPA: XdhC family protein, partial [Myxococcales bacterium]|nr:XdhC family protein [Myxococcales bacterium]